jgi:hypothetical protein
MKRNGPSPKISAFARELAGHPIIKTAVWGAFEGSLPLAIEDLLSRISPGELYGLYGPKTTNLTRVEREQRIRDALQAGRAPAEIGKQENITPRHVRRIRSRIGHGGTGA